MTDMDGSKGVIRPRTPVTATPEKVMKIDDYVVAFYPNDEWEVGSQDSDVYDDADNQPENSSQDIAMQELLRKLREKLPSQAMTGHDAAADHSYDLREFARTIRANWKIIAPTLTAASGVAAIALITIGTRGSVSGASLSMGTRWAAWAVGYLMMQATIVIGGHCIPSIRCR